MKILMITPGAYGVNGGIALYNRDIIEALDAINTVSSITVLPREIQLDAEPIPSKVRFVKKAAESKIRFAGELLKEMTAHYDIIVCSHINLLPIALTFARRSHARLVLIVYGIDVWTRPERRCSSWGLKSVDAIWTISEITANRMNIWAELPQERYILLPNAIHLDRYGMGGTENPLAAKLNVSGRKVLLTLARLPGFDRYKGVDEVLECLPEIVAADPNIIYVIAGEGEDRRRLEGKAAALGMKDYVIFTGFVDEKDKPYYYQLADVFVMPGRGEGFGFVFLEALACGVPVIGSILDGSREALIDGQLGDLVDPRDLEQVKSATLRALTKPKVIPHGLEYFSWPSFRERIAAAVESLRNK